MPDTTTVEELNNSIEALLSGEAPGLVSDPALGEMLALAMELQALPDPEFKETLKATLLDEVESDQHANGTDIPGLALGTARIAPSKARDLPTLLGGVHTLYPVQRSSFMASVIAHAAVLALIVTSGIWAAQSVRETPRVSSTVLTDVSPYIPPGEGDQSGGGGGGGTHDKLHASKGMAPQFKREQIAPPVVVLRNEDPKLKVESSVVGPPEISFPKASMMGDPFSGIVRPPSNGTGSAAGNGDGAYGGVGSGSGAGIGPGEGGGIGGGIYRVGVGGVSAPRLISDPEPEYSEEGRKARHQGSVLLQVIVGTDGRLRDVRVIQPLGFGLDEKAVEAVRQWRFEPAKKNGQPVTVVVNIEVNFRLY